VLSILGLERWVAADVDELEVESELVLDSANDLERTGAEAAVGGVIQRDLNYGYRPLVVVASATR
jgi:hypothetical protein